MLGTDRRWGASGSHPLVIRIDSYSHYPASRQTSKLSVLELQSEMQRRLFGDSVCPGFNHIHTFELNCNIVRIPTILRMFFFFYLFRHRPWNEIPRGLLSSGETVQDGLARYLSLQTNLVKNRM